MKKLPAERRVIERAVVTTFAPFYSTSTTAAPTHSSGPSRARDDWRARDRRSSHDLQPGNLVALEREAVPQFHGTAGEIAGDPCDDNNVCAGHIYREGSLV